MEHLPGNYEDHLNQHENSHKLCSETGFNSGVKAIVEQILAAEERNPKEQECESYSQGSR